MAGISERPKKRGGTTYQVRWFTGGTRAGKQQYESFTTRGKAERFKLLVEESGEHWPEDWVPGKGFVGAVDSAPSRDRATVQAMLTRYVDQLTDIGPDTRSRYLTQAALLDTMLARPTAWDVTDEDVRRWVLAFGRPPYSRSPKTASNYHGLLAAAFEWGLGKNLVSTNPCRGTRLPRRDIDIDGEDEVKFFLHQEYALFWGAMHADSRDLIDVLVGSGLRFGEATALWAKDIDPESRTIRVRRSWKREGKGGVRPDSVSMQAKHDTNRGCYLGPPKTKRARRTVQVSPAVMEILVRRIAGLASDDFVFTTSPRSPHSTNVRWMGGRAINHSDFYTSRWEPAVEAAIALGLPRRPKIKDLRSTYAVWLINEGVNVINVQRNLGHESSKTTGDIYADFMPESSALADTAIERALRARHLRVVNDHSPDRED